MRKAAAIFFCFAIIPFFAFTQSPGDIIVTEVMQDPAFVTDANGEWFEVYNRSNQAIDMDGWVLKDNASNLYTIPASLIIQPQGFLVFGINGNTATNGGVTVDRVVNSFSLGNTTDAIIIKTPGGLTIDSIAWDGGTLWPDPTGASMVFTGCASADNNLGTNWTTATVRELNYSGNGTDLGSPGTIGVLQGLVNNYSASANQPTCGSTNGGVNLTLSGCGAPFTYAWSNGTFSEDLANVGIGTYIVTVTGTGVSIVDTFALAATGTASLSLVPTDASCAGINNGAINLTVSGGNPSFTFLWSNNATTEDILGLAPGNYTVTVTDNFGCTNSDSVNVGQGIPFTSSGTTTPANCVAASNGSIDLSVSGASTYTYIWSSADTTQDLSGILPGTYSVTITDNNGCIGSDTITVTLLPQMTTGVFTQHASCNGTCDGSLNLTVNNGSSPFTYSWSSADSTEDISNLCAGNYSVTITDSAGCSVSASTTVSQPAVLALFMTSTPETGSNSDGTANAAASGGTAPYSYAWVPGGATTQTITGLSAGTYIVEVTDANGCVATDTVVVDNLSSGTPSDPGTISMIVFPNPAEDFIHIRIAENLNPYHVEILSAEGRTMKVFANNNHIFELETKTLPDGFYFVCVTTAEGKIVRRIAIQH